MSENTASLPKTTEEDIKSHFQPSEKIVKFICPQRNNAKNSVYIVLTNLSVFFYKTEPNKEPFIALLALNKIKEIEYLLQLNNDVAVTFIPFGDAANSITIKFLKRQRSELDDFCEDLADIVSFKIETAHGDIKTLVAPKIKPGEAKLAPNEENGPIILHAASGVPRPELSGIAPQINKLKQKEAPKAEAKTALEKKLEAIPPKIVGVSSAKKQVKTQTNTDSLPKQPPKSAGKPANNSANANKTKRHSTAGDALAATAVSTAAAFLWYYFFRKLAKSRA